MRYNLENVGEDSSYESKKKCAKNFRYNSNVNVSFTEDSSPDENLVDFMIQNSEENFKKADNVE